MKKLLSILTVMSLLLIPLLTLAQSPKQDFFWVAFDADSSLMPTLSGGTMDDPGEDGTWWQYPEWWNIWFYDHPFDITRYKEVYLQFYIYPYDSLLPSDVEIVINWSTQFWPVQNPPGPPIPSLFPPPDEDIVLSRSETMFEYHGFIYMSDPIYYSFTNNFIFPWYNPEWVSVDIRGANFQIYKNDSIPGEWSEIVHWCYAKPQDPDSVEMGDAPEGDSVNTVLAYLPSTWGFFPTCVTIGPPGSYISHGQPSPAFFGGMVDAELNGNSGICDPYNFPYNNDECANNPVVPPGPAVDEGLIFPAPYTIIGPAGSELYQSCSGVDDTLAEACSLAKWGTDIDIWINTALSGPVFLNVLFDWTQDGRWSGTANCSGSNVNEHVLHNFVIPAGISAPLSTIAGLPAGFMTGPNEGFVWARFSLTDQPVPFDWDGHGIFADGETEDYLLYIAPSSEQIPLGNWSLIMVIVLIAIFIAIFWRKKLF